MNNNDKVHLIAFVLYLIGLFVFKVDNAFKFGEYSVQAFFYLGIAILLYRYTQKKK